MATFDPKTDIIMVDYLEKRICKEHRDLTRGVIESIHKFYPEFRIILVTDYPKEDEINKTRDLENIVFVYVPDLGDYNLDRIGEGHGIGLDEGVKYIQSEYFFTADQDILMLQSGYPEKIIEMMEGKIQAVGPGMSNKFTIQGKGRPFIAPYFSVWKIDPIRRFHLTFAQIYLSQLAFSTGQFLCYRLLSAGLDYRTIDLGFFREYIKHWVGKE